MAKKEKKVYSKAELMEHELKQQLKRLSEQLDYIPLPTYFYEIGEEVEIGNLEDCVIKDVLENGKIYLIDYTSVHNNYGNLIRIPNSLQYASWLLINKKGNNTALSKKDDLRISFHQGRISSLLMKVYSMGVDFEPEYQRGYVWELEDKIALIDSIFNNVEIGKFAFIELNSKEWISRKLQYEILDGKQRLSTLCEFYEGKFEYKGYKFHELSHKDRYHFTDYSVSIAELGEATEKQVIEYFIKLNSHGKVMDKEHLEKVKQLIL